MKTLILLIRYGGLGDHLFYSHLPRIAKESGLYDKVYISNKSKYRSWDYKKYIWEMNPYIDGFCDEEGELIDIIPIADDSMNLLDVVMLSYGLDDGKRWHEPELYYRPKYNEKMKNTVIYDPNYFSHAGLINGQEIDRYFNQHGIKIDYQLEILNKRNIAIARFNSILAIKDFADFCSVIISCKEIYCLVTGTATLASALGKKACVFWGKGRPLSKEKVFHHSKKHTYIFIEPSLLHEIGFKLGLVKI